MSKLLPPTPPEATSSSDSEPKEEQLIEHAPVFWMKPRGKKLSKKLSMLEVKRNAAWEKHRRQQLLNEERRKQQINNGMAYLTDEDLSELRGSIELGFGFNEENGQELCKTLPALDLFFAVNRQLSSSPILSPNTPGSNCSLEPSTLSSSPGARSSSFGSPRSDFDSWKIISPGDDPQLVKRRLRHWAQAVACSVMQSREITPYN